MSQQPARLFFLGGCAKSPTPLDPGGWCLTSSVADLCVLLTQAFLVKRSQTLPHCDLLLVGGSRTKATICLRGRHLYHDLPEQAKTGIYLK